MNPFDGPFERMRREALRVRALVGATKSVTGGLSLTLAEVARQQQALTTVQRDAGLTLGVVQEAQRAYHAFNAQLAGSSIGSGPNIWANFAQANYPGMPLDHALKLQATTDQARAVATKDLALSLRDRDLFMEAQRNARWAAGLTDHSAEIDRLIGANGTKDLAETLHTAKAIADYTKDARTVLGITGGKLRDTSIKMSAFAGALDTTGSVSAATLASAHALLGYWQSLPDLPPAYWRDRKTRTRLYRDAEVDEGVIEAEQRELIDVLVESGMVEGSRTRSGTNVAVIRAGPMRVRIIGGRPRSGTYEAIDTLDTALKTLIDSTLTQNVGNRWFVQHVDGKVAQGAKEKRQAARRAGEPHMQLIYYLDLGQLIDIVRDKRHWKFFEPVFLDLDAFVVNLRRLNTIRRPTMHGRGLDQVQVLEAIVLVHRLTEAITRTCAIDAGWDDDI